MHNLKRLEHNKFVLIGASTGGPLQVQKIITALPHLKDTTVIVAQHMAKGFIPSFIKRLNDYTKNTISMASDSMEVEHAHIYLCNGHTSVFQRDSSLYFRHTAAGEYTYNPDINFLFNSFVPFVNQTKILSIILTGIGDDGVDGCKNLAIGGATCITESADSAIVDGMPNRARELVPNVIVLGMDDIIKSIVEFCE